MSLDITYLGNESSRRHTEWYYEAVPHAATNYTAGGDVIDLTGASAGAKPMPLPYHVPSDREVIIEVVKGGHSVDVVVDAAPTMKNAKLKIFTAAATELAAGAYPATLTAIRFSIRQRRSTSNSV